MLTTLTRTAGRATAASRLSSTGNLIRRHAPFTALLTGGALLRVVTMLGYPPILWFTGDSYFYTTYAEHLIPSRSKTLGYPFFLRLLEPFHSWALIAVLQHVMGLATAVLLYALLRRAGLPGWGAALATVPVLYDGYEIQLEHMVMAEALFMLLLMAAVTIVLWRARGPAWIPAVAGLLVGWAVLVRSAGLVVLPLLLLCMVIRRSGVRAVAACAAGCVLPLVAYAIWYHSATGSYNLTSADGFLLWGRTSSFADCKQINPPPAERRLCLSTPVGKRAAPGVIVWDPAGPQRHLPGGVVSDSNNALQRSFALHAIAAQPLSYVKAVVKGVGKAFLPHRHHYPSRFTESHYHFPAKPYVFFPNGVQGVKPIVAAHRYDPSAPSRVVQPFARFMRGYQSVVSLPGPVLLLIFVTGAVGLVRRRAPRTLVLTAWGAAVALLVFPVMVIDFDYRYVLPAVPFACLAAALTFARKQAPAHARKEAPVRTEAPEEGAEA